MSHNYYLQSGKEQLVDSPFAKLSSFFNVVPSRLGIPPIPVNSDFKPTDLHRRAAEVLELTERDGAFVANRIKHLDFIARYSSLADRMNWRSSIKGNEEYGREFDTPIKFSASSSNPSVILSGIKQSNVIGNKLNWYYSLATEGNSNTFILSDDLGNSRLVSVLIDSVGLIPLGDSGYTLRIANNMGGGESMTGSVTITMPYVGNILPIKTNILANNDLLIQITANAPELLQYFKSDSLPEDVVAAFILAIDSI